MAAGGEVSARSV